jgi:hypothetical protein
MRQTSRYSATIEAAMPDPDLSAAEFAPLKARLARAYLEHKPDVGAPHATDKAVVNRTDEITATHGGRYGRGDSRAPPHLVAGIVS